MTRILERLKGKDRTLLELQTGITDLGILMQMVGAVLIGTGVWTASAGGEIGQARFAQSLWFGIVAALCASLHMYRTLDIGLRLDERSAQRKVALGYTIRYGIGILLMLAICLTDAMDPLVFFLALMTLKFGAYLQPLTHKAYNRLFHETDPVPMSQEEWDALQASEAGAAERAGS